MSLYKKSDFSLYIINFCLKVFSLNLKFIKGLIEFFFTNSAKIFLLAQIIRILQNKQNSLNPSPNFYTSPIILYSPKMSMDLSTTQNYQLPPLSFNQMR